MTKQEYEEIINAARAKFDHYVNMEKAANYPIHVTRKEDFLSYWIAVEAKERGKAMDGV